MYKWLKKGLRSTYDNGKCFKKAQTSSKYTLIEWGIVHPLNAKEKEISCEYKINKLYAYIL